MKITIQCPECATKYTVDEKFAGRKLTCKKCELKFTIAAGSAAAPQTAERSSPSPGARPAPVPPVPDDIYGLAEEALPPRTPGATAAASPSNLHDDEPRTLSRPGSTTPLTETQKKRIAKRADKIEKSKPFRSNAAFGVSFGTVLAIALFGWRVQRALTKAQRLDKRNQAVQAAPAEVVDLKAYAAEIDEDSQDMIAKNEAAEAREWLDLGKYQNHEVTEMTNQAAREIVDGFYERGAYKVYVSPLTLGDKVFASAFFVRLPADPSRRKQCFDWMSKVPDQEYIMQDYGQKYLLVRGP